MVVALVLWPLSAWAQDGRPPLVRMPDAARVVGDLRELTVGKHAAEFPLEGYYAFACGSNGGTPLEQLDDWTGFAQCARDRATGLHEVYVEYDDEGEYIARMLAERFGPEEGRLGLRKYYGTKVAGHPVVLSVLFDERGIAQAIRAVTDQRADLDYRRNAYLLRVPLMNTFGAEGWDCVHPPLAAGETPVGNFAVKMRCEKVVPGGRRMVVEAHLYRKPGQTGYDRTGASLAGDFFSQGRWEIWNADYAAPR
ncbi:MAG: hypothetical protein FJX64_07725 [Alphaproteobacteria bacterium]|nr:hypothetical protein [Alphaproteobacteria bacterium]